MKPTINGYSDTAYEYVIVEKESGRFVFDAGDRTGSRELQPTFTFNYKKANYYYDLDCAVGFMNEYMKMGFSNKLSIMKLSYSDVDITGRGWDLG